MLAKLRSMAVIGIDAFGFDRPFAAMAEDFRRTGDGRYIWPAHFAGIVATYPAAGAGIVGGCCGTPPESIAALAAALRR